MSHRIVLIVNVSCSICSSSFPTSIMSGRIGSHLVDFDVEVDAAGMIRTRSNSILITGSSWTVDLEATEFSMLRQVNCAQ